MVGRVFSEPSVHDPSHSKGWGGKNAHQPFWRVSRFAKGRFASAMSTSANHTAKIANCRQGSDVGLR